jgi:hypothetical protein
MLTNLVTNFSDFITPKYTNMKFIQITFGTLATLGLSLGLLVLFTQPFATAQTNDACLASLFLLGAASAALFMWASNQLAGANIGCKVDMLMNDLYERPE